MIQQEMQKLNKYLEKPCNKIVCRGKADDDVWHIGTIHYDKHKIPTILYEYYSVYINF